MSRIFRPSTRSCDEISCPLQVASLGKYGSASGELRHPVSVAATSRGKNLRIFVSERLNKRVQELTADGGHVRTYGSRTSPRSAATPPPEEEGAHIPGGSTFVGEPRGVATCARGHVYAVDAVAGKPGRVLVWDADGRAVRALGPAIAGNCRVLGEVDGAMLDPVGISIAPGSESVWVSHKLAISAVRSRPGGATGVEEPSSSASAAVCVVSCFCARSGAWRGVVAGTHHHHPETQHIVFFQSRVLPEMLHFTGYRPSIQSPGNPRSLCILS